MKRVHKLMQSAVYEDVFPGGVLLASLKGEIVFLRAYGLERLGTRRRVTQQTVFDLASLTKPLATALALMRLTELGRLDLDQGLGTLLPAFEGTEKAEITPAQLLSHRAGLPAWRPYFISLSHAPVQQRKKLLEKFLIREPLAGCSGQDRIYSDIGFMILGWLAEKLAGQSLDQFVADAVYRPLGVEGLFFSSPGNSQTVSFAATERCCLRNRVLEGEVHDENAWVMGGVAGHAGLFGNAETVWRLLCGLTDIYKGRADQALFQRETVRRWFMGNPGWGPLGFDAPSAKGSSAGRFFGPRSVGHLGFAGTSFWLDPDLEAIIILMTNRIHPSRANIKIKAFRPVIHDEIMKTLAVES